MIRMNYLGYELKNYIVSAVKDLKFTEFTEIQRCVFDEFKTDKNILAKSKQVQEKLILF